MYDTLRLLDGILKNNGYEMLAKEYKLINITPFMEMMKLAHFLSPPSQRELRREIPCDLRGDGAVLKKECTLKSLEAYKRVKGIKKMSE